MSDIIRFEDRKRKNKSDGHPPLVITRMVDGELVEYVNRDEREFFVQADSDKSAD